MTDYTELKRLAFELIAANDLFNESPQDNEIGDAWSLANDRFTEAASPEVIQALIAENERLKTLRSVTERDLAQELEVWRHGPSCWNCGDTGDVHDIVGEWRGKCDCNAAKLIDVAYERDQLRAEVAGLRTGYEAYERVNAELKAEVEGLRKLGPSKEIIWCACGDGYPVNSYGAGFMDANNGACANCDAALGQGEQS